LYFASKFLAQTAQNLFLAALFVSAGTSDSAAVGLSSIFLAMLLPALVSGWLLSFTLSLDDLVISSFVSGPGATTLPMYIFAKVRLGVTPDINALATIIIGVVSLGVVVAGVVMLRRERAIASPPPRAGVVQGRG
jgi:ABC-type spermidine/putrescine transport system permease subunit II